MPRRDLPNGVAAATALFRTEGLELPLVPTELARRFRQRGPWCFASRPVRVSPYEFDHYVAEAGAASDYVLIAHAGHGVNSYGLHYYLVRGPLRLFLQVHWGGVYQDKPTATARANACFRLAAELVSAVQNAGRRGRFRSADRVVVVASDFYGGSCALPGQENGVTRVRPDRSDLPNELMTRALDWCILPIFGDRAPSGQQRPKGVR